jgi:CheY-like chemotaxis protein
VRILLAEDNEINQQIALELLEGVGAKVEVANHGQEAVEKLMREPTSYDLVLMDLQMPEMDGYQATARIRSDPRFVKLPIIAMTAHATLEERQRCLNTGMNDHVSKPIDPALLFETLGRYYKPAENAAVPAISKPEQPESPAADTGDVPSIEGLDTLDGLRRVGGNQKLYMNLLRKFVDQQGQAPAQIAEALARGEEPVAERLAHTVKGLAGSLGSRTVQQAAASLEKAITSRVPSAEYNPILEEFNSVLHDFVSRLSAALPPSVAEPEPTAGAVPLDPEQGKQVVREMIGYLNKFDPAAEECLEINRDVFRALLPGESLVNFRQEVGEFAFANALVRLEEAAKEKGLLL